MPPCFSSHGEARLPGCGCYGSDKAPIALLLAGRIAIEPAPQVTIGLLLAAARYRHTGSGLARATGWLAKALECDASGSSRGVFAACSRGLDVLDEHQMTLGSSELRALATRHGEAMAGLALRQAATRHRPRSLLQWTERWRATALTQPPVRPPNELDLVAELAAMRDCVRRLDDARANGSPTAGLEQERSRLERAIRSRRLKVAGEQGKRERFDVDRLVSEVGTGVSRRDRRDRPAPPCARRRARSSYITTREATPTRRTEWWSSPAWPCVRSGVAGRPT